MKGRVQEKNSPQNRVKTIRQKDAPPFKVQEVPRPKGLLEGNSWAPPNYDWTDQAKFEFQGHFEGQKGQKRQKRNSLKIGDCFGGDFWQTYFKLCQSLKIFFKSSNLSQFLLSSTCL